MGAQITRRGDHVDLPEDPDILWVDMECDGLWPILEDLGGQIRKHGRLAWAAGFIDGEAWVGLKRGYAQIETDQIVIPPLLRLLHLFGGSVLKLKPRITKTGRHVQAWRWALGGANAVAALRRVEPLLIVKGDAARRCIDLNRSTR